MKERIEDLGRLAEKLNQMIQMDMWTDQPMLGHPDFEEKYLKLSSDLERLFERLCDAQEIAEGCDNLNKREHESRMGSNR